MKKLILVALVAFVFSGVGCTRVTPTEAGFRINNAGDYRGIDSLPLLTGFQFYMPGFSSIVTMPTTQQHIVWSEEGQEDFEENTHITVSCMGGAGFKMDVGLNYRVNYAKASKIYLKYRNDDLESITKSYLRNVVRGSMQDVSGTITVDSMLNNLPRYEETVRNIITKRFEVEGFILDNYSIISQPKPNDTQLARAINDKIKAKQEAETKKMQLQSSIAESNKKIATAKGDSAAKVIRASGEAIAIRKLQEQVTATYVDYVKWSNASKDVARVPQIIGSPNMLYSIK